MSARFSTKSATVRSLRETAEILTATQKWLCRDDIDIDPVFAQQLRQQLAQAMAMANDVPRHPRT
jgi:hypothetical protein